MYANMRLERLVETSFFQALSELSRNEVILNGNFKNWLAGIT